MELTTWDFTNLNDQQLDQMITEATKELRLRNIRKAEKYAAILQNAINAMLKKGFVIDIDDDRDGFDTGYIYLDKNSKVHIQVSC